MTMSTFFYNQFNLRERKLVPTLRFIRASDDRVWFQGPANARLVSRHHEGSLAEGVGLPTVCRVFDRDSLLELKVLHEDGARDCRASHSVGLFQHNLMKWTMTKTMKLTIDQGYFRLNLHCFCSFSRGSRSRGAPGAGRSGERAGEPLRRLRPQLQSRSKTPLRVSAASQRGLPKTLRIRMVAKIVPETRPAKRCDS